MNRRLFLQMGAMSPAILPSHPMRTARAQFTIDGTVSAQMIISASAHEKRAEQWRKGWQYRAFEGQGEWYLQTSRRLALPDHLTAISGTLMYHTFVIGYAAAERSMLVGTLRRENVACVLRIMGNNQAEMVDLADWFAVQELPELWELMWSGAQLQRLFPNTQEFGRDIEFNDSFWP